MPRVVDDVLGQLQRSRASSPSQSRSYGRTQQVYRPKPRTVVKARFRTLGKTPNAGKIRASGVMANINYMTQRPDFQGHRMSRDIVMPDRIVNFREDGEKGKLFVSQMLEQSKDKYIYHLILSSGSQDMTKIETEAWARAVLERAGIRNYMIVAHAGEAGHTENPHAHIVIFRDAKLEREDFYSIRQIGDQESALTLDMLKDLKREYEARGASGGGLEIEPEKDYGESSKKKQLGIDFD